MIKNIIKRVIVGVLIALVLSFISSCDVKANTINPTYIDNGFDYYSGLKMYNCSSASSCTEMNGTAYNYRANLLQFYNSTNDSPGDDKLLFNAVYNNNISTFGSNGVVFSMLMNSIGLINNSIYSTTAYLCTEQSASLDFYEVYVSNTYGNFINNPAQYSHKTIVNQMSGSNFFNNISGTFDRCYMISFIFVPNTDGQVLSIRLSSNGSIGSGWQFLGSQTKYIGVADNLKKSDVENALANSGFATATSVSQVQASVNQVRQELNNLDTSIQQQTQQQHQDAQQTQQKLDDINNTMKDDNTSDVDTSAISGASSSVATNNVISDLILLPVNLFTKILNSLSGNCASISLGTLFGTALTMPCINLQNYLGNTLYNVIDVIISGLLVYVISKRMIKIFNQLSQLKEGGGID